ncbi:MAG TPA: RsmD family RNA methyltransferase, partial [Acidiferrobacteraceae bacterium]|nr:RsmD family RNA methyltransferase [Acidiferrobacteraceae bacterium]
LLRNDTAARALEGLERTVEIGYGEVPEQVAVCEGDARFLAPLHSGQKTGWFFDQRINRARMGAYVRGARVLDLYSYLGAWGIQAALRGAQTVVCVDSSRNAIAHVEEHARMNGCEARVRAEMADVPEFLRAARSAGTQFDVVILDPPAFIRRRKDVSEGLSAYRRVNQLAAQVLADDGILISSSCSYHLERSALWDAVNRAGRRRAMTVQMLEEGGQGPDHPVHPAIPETAYLKTLFARLLQA